MCPSHVNNVPFVVRKSSKVMGGRKFEASTREGLVVAQMYVPVSEGLIIVLARSRENISAAMK